MNVVLYNYLVWYFTKISHLGYCNYDLSYIIMLLNVVDGLFPYQEYMTNKEIDLLKNALYCIGNDNSLPFDVNMGNEEIISWYMTNIDTVSGWNFIDTGNVPILGIFGVDFTVSNGNVSGVINLDVLDGGLL